MSTKHHCVDERNYVCYNIPDPTAMNQKRESEPTTLPPEQLRAYHNPLWQRADYFETVENLSQRIPIVLREHWNLNDKDEGILIFFRYCG
jgi:hypothetical protein